MTRASGKVICATPAPTPAMVDAHVERKEAGEEGFLHDTAPKFELKPNRRLDGKAHLMEYERWNRDWARGSGDDPKGLAREYEGYIRDLDKDHGHDSGLIFARDLTQQVEKHHGTGSDLAKQIVTLLADRPDLQRAYLGGDVPKHPPQGTFKPGGKEAVERFIDDDRVANGIAPKYAKAAAQDTASVQRVSTRAAPEQAPQSEPNPNNLLEYGPNFGLPVKDSALPVETQASAPATKSEDFAESSDMKDGNPQEAATGRPPERRECTEIWLKIWENNERQNALSTEKLAIENDIQRIESLIASRNRDRIREYLDTVEQPDRDIPEPDPDRRERPPSRPGGGRPRPVVNQMMPGTGLGRGPRPAPQPSPPTPPRPEGQKLDWKEAVEALGEIVEKGAEFLLPRESIEAAIAAAQQRLDARRRDLARVEQRLEAARIQLEKFKEERERHGCDARGPSETRSDLPPSAQPS